MLQPVTAMKNAASLGAKAVGAVADGVGAVTGIDTSAVSGAAKNVDKAVNWAYCHAHNAAEHQMKAWQDGFDHHANQIADGCGSNGSFKDCLNSVNEAKNAEIIDGIPITVGDAVSYGADAIAPGSG